ncbi:MAG: MBL fold metallo-hydrolase [Deltaproteobacteria bacterium]|nr:MBL fold metallo-hydrolase [Deltaproteobacteria bacterium]
MAQALGNATLTMVNGGDFRLDGGAMHGVVPKTIWSKLVSCDELNRVTYTTSCLLVEIGKKRVLIETGNGDKFSAKEKEIYGIDHDRSISSALGALGVEPESIDLVVLTHLHFDHVGGTTRRTKSGGLVPVFPRARHVVQRTELIAAEHPHERNRASYLAENILPLKEAGLFAVIDGETELLPGLRVLPSPGHTPGHQSVLIDGGNGEKALFLGDVAPTSVHVRLPFIMAYDLEVEKTLDSKKRLFCRAITEGWIVLFGHDRHHGAKLRWNDKGQPEVAELVEL